MYWYNVCDGAYGLGTNDDICTRAYVACEVEPLYMLYMIYT